MKTSDIRNIAIRFDGSRFSVHFDTIQARYHFWLYNGEPMTDGKLYMNPHLDVDRRSPGHFNTRYLKPSTATNAKIIKHVMDVVRAGNMVQGAEEAFEKGERDKEEARKRDLANRVRRALDQEIVYLKEDGYTNVVALELAAKDLPQDSLIRLHQAIMARAA